MKERESGPMTWGKQAAVRGKVFQGDSRFFVAISHFSILIFILS